MKVFVALLFFALSVPSLASVAPGDTIPASDTITRITEVADTVQSSQGSLATGGAVVDLTSAGGFSLTSFLRGLLGMIVIVLIAWVFSNNRKKINWVVVLTGLLIQLTLAVSILYIPFVRYSFEFVGKIFVKILDFTKEGSIFLFGSMMDMEKFGMIFAFQILPTIIFFSALTSLLVLSGYNSKDCVGPGMAYDQVTKA